MSNHATAEDACPTAPAPQARTLAPQHLAMLEASAITSEVRAARGYSTETVKAELERLGFGRAQRLPGLVIPIYNIYGELATHVLRPDHPRMSKRKGRRNKYEFPYGVHMVLDVPNLPWLRAALRDPKSSLWITEGSKKADSLASHGCCAVSVIGVYNFRGKNDEGGMTLLADFEPIALNDRSVYIAYDSDVMTKEAVHGALARLGAVLKNRQAHVHYVYLPATTHGDKQGIDDYLAAGHTVPEAVELSTPTLKLLPKEQEEGEDERPRIVISTDMAGVVDAGMAAIASMPDAPHVWQRAGQLSMVGMPPHLPKSMQRDPETPLMMPLPQARLTELASSAATWWKMRRNGPVETLSPSIPPPWFAPTVFGRPGWNFPVLHSVVECPTLRQDGTMLETPGYDAASGLYFAKNGQTFLPVPETPTWDDARAALTTLLEPLADFPLQEEHHTSAALAALLTLVGRQAIRGHTPMFAITSPRAGSGKSLLADVLALIATGRTAPRWAHTVEEEEQNKSLLSIALAGDRLVCIDNITRPFGSAALDRAVTGGTIAARLLGVNREMTVPWHTVVFLTGNNMVYQRDTPRRVVPIVVDPQVENPEQRSGFQHADLHAWVTVERPRLLQAALTVLRAYLVAGCPPQDIPAYGGFQPWSNLIRGCLVWCDFADPNLGRVHIEVENDPSYERLATALQCWADCLGTVAITLQELKQKIDYETRPVQPIYTPSETLQTPENLAQWTALRDALGAFDRRYDGRSLDVNRLGYTLREYRNRILGGRRFTSHEGATGHHARAWYVSTVSPQKEGT